MAPRTDTSCPNSIGIYWLDVVMHTKTHTRLCTCTGKTHTNTHTHAQTHMQTRLHIYTHTQTLSEAQTCHRPMQAHANLCIHARSFRSRSSDQESFGLCSQCHPSHSGSQHVHSVSERAVIISVTCLVISSPSSASQPRFIVC